jgi:hypothetical protein
MSSATTSRRRSRRGKSHRPKVDISQLGDLHQIIDRARAGPLPDEECQKIRDVLGTLSWLQSELQNKNLTIARLRRLFGLTSSEKTRDVCGDPSGKNQAASGAETRPGKTKLPPAKRVRRTAAIETPATAANETPTRRANGRAMVETEHRTTPARIEWRLSTIR